MGRGTKVWKYLLHQVESGLRKTNLFSLRSYEVEEVVQMFVDLEPSAIYVVDKEPKVLEATPARDGIYSVKSDIASQPLPYGGDIVICYNTVQRSENPEDAFDHVCRAVNPGGLLSIDTGYFETEYPGFDQLTEHLYFRREISLFT